MSEFFEILRSALLGIIQGLTEFLPISSSGHLVLAQKLLHFDQPSLAFDTMLHLGTLVAVIVYFWSDVWAILKRPWGKMTWMLVIATIPSVVASLLFKDQIDHFFQSGITLGFEFLFTGLVLLLAQQMRPGNKQLREMTWYDSLLIGIGQMVSIMPAVSRSGMTIATGMTLKYDREYVARFAMLMSIPAILGAVVFQGKDVVEQGLGNINFLVLGVGVLFAAIAGYFAIKWLVRVLTKGKLTGFAIYVLVLGALVLVDQNLTHFFF